MKKTYRRHKEKIDYILAGIWNTIFGYFLFLALYYFFNRAVHYMFIMIASAVISITNAYISYKLIVFKTTGNYLKEYARFFAMYGALFAVNLAFLPFLVEIFKMPPASAQGIIILFSVFISYFGHKYFSFGYRKT